MMDLRYEIPVGFTIDHLLSIIAEFADTELALREFCLRTYYDSFDWRLYRNDILCEFNRSQGSSILELKSLKSGHVFAAIKTSEVPFSPVKLKSKKVRTTLVSFLEERALLPLCTLEFEGYQFLVHDRTGQLIMRILVEDFELIHGHMNFFPVRGFTTKSEAIITAVVENMFLKPALRPILESALALEGRLPNDYSSKIKIVLDPVMRADLAAKTVFGTLLKTIKANEQGVIANWDPEFLHDFRIAIRRTRTGLGQLKGVLTPDTTRYFSEFFGWLGQVTGPARDIDVYLQKLELYRQHLPPLLQADFEPFIVILKQYQQQFHADLANQLNSAHYTKSLAEWEQCLKSQAYPANSNLGNIDIKTLADWRIWKIYRRVLEEGSGINAHSPAEALHDLRKLCKKLRYLIEFFQGFYPKHSVKKLLKHLKTLQDVLGEFQDFDSQIAFIERSVETEKDALTPATLNALGELIRQLVTHKNRARKHYRAVFDDFALAKNYDLFKAVFGGG